MRSIHHLLISVRLLDRDLWRPLASSTSHNVVISQVPGRNNTHRGSGSEQLAEPQHVLIGTSTPTSTQYITARGNPVEVDLREPPLPVNHVWLITVDALCRSCCRSLGRQLQRVLCCWLLTNGISSKLTCAFIWRRRKRTAIVSRRGRPEEIGPRVVEVTNRFDHDTGLVGNILRKDSSASLTARKA